MKPEVFVVFSLSLAFAGCRETALPEGKGPAFPHVLLLHLDGYRADLVRRLLEEGRLPNLGLLASRGRISYEATTVDK
ncbi:MAG TPA: hypothetical protein VIG29_05865, partial [Vicinamibacteria bacterium]